jgi:hypothetical protein
MGRDRSWPDATVVSMQVLIDSAISQTLSMSLHPVMEASQGHRDIRQPLSARESSVSSAAGTVDPAFVWRSSAYTSLHVYSNIARVVGRVAERMSGLLGRPVIIENISGADGSIGTGRAARAAPDGYTIIVGQTSTLVFNGAMRSLQYDVLNDFAPISPLAAAPLVLFARKTMAA